MGNWVADEVLYQAKLYPEVKANSLTDAEIKELHKAIKYVPEAAVEAEADSEKFPPGQYSVVMAVLLHASSQALTVCMGDAVLHSLHQVTVIDSVHWSTV